MRQASPRCICVVRKCTEGVGLLGAYRLPMRDAMRFHRLPISLWPATSTRSSCSAHMSIGQPESRHCRDWHGMTLTHTARKRAGSSVSRSRCRRR